MVEANASRCGMLTAIVEDERDLVRVYRMIFGQIGIPVCFVAYDGPGAVRQFLACAPRPRVVLMDNNLPAMSGVEVTKEIIKAEPDTRVIFLSGDPCAREEAIRAGAFLFLHKPASIGDIRRSVESAWRSAEGTRDAGGQEEAWTARPQKSQDGSPDIALARTVSR